MRLVLQVGVSGGCSQCCPPSPSREVVRGHQIGGDLDLQRAVALPPDMWAFVETPG